GDLAIDIGANIGDTTVPMALCAGSTGLSLAFDPNPYVFKILQRNATLNPDKVNIVACPYAIDKEEGEFFFIASEASFGNGGISKTKKSPHGKFVHTEKIQSVNLFSFIKKEYPQWINKLKFIKIDTEGHDKEIIKSISDLISSTKPYIIAESIGSATDNEKIQLYEIIDSLNYDMYYFQDFNIKAPVKKLNTKEDILNWKETINIYAKPKS
ncbi:MAG TPA: FkbM family methyltransferase, partial [Segetibacter sp.]